MYPFVNDPATAVTFAAMLHEEHVAAAHGRRRRRDLDRVREHRRRGVPRRVR